MKKKTKTNLIMISTSIRIYECTRVLIASNALKISIINYKNDEAK